MEDPFDFDPATIDSLDLQSLSNLPISDELELFIALADAIGSDAESPTGTGKTGSDQENAATESNRISSEPGPGGCNVDEGKP
jgi:hypothetical protein